MKRASSKRCLGIALEPTSTTVPPQLLSWFSCLEQKGLDEEGIFRVSGNAIMRQKFQQALTNGEEINLEECDVHDIAGLIKLYFRELPTPLFTFELYDCFIAAIVSKHDSTLLGVDIIRKVVKLLPPGHYCVLQILMEFLRKVRSHCLHNKMSVTNLATVFAPNLLRAPGGDMKVTVTDYPFQISLLVAMIENFDDIFETPEAEKARVAARTKERSLKFKKMMEQKYCNGNMVNGLAELSTNSLSAEEIQQKMQAKYSKIRHSSDRFLELEQKLVPNEVFLKRISEMYEKIQQGDVMVDEIDKERDKSLRRLSELGGPQR